MSSKLLRPAALALAAALLCQGLAAAGAQAALPKKNEATVQGACNPRPDASDVLLPMPGGLSMAFHIVAVPTEGFLWDLSLHPGSPTAEKDRAFYDRPWKTSLSAPFSKEDLPKAWQALLPQGKNFYYLIAKYEVTRLQWKAVMQPGADLQPTPSDLRPMAGITWYEALDFTRRYTEWLLANHPDSLPRYRGDSRNTGFLRLPTEVEWEYAARGGHAVGTQELRREPFFAMKEGTSPRDYAVYQVPGTSHRAEDTVRIGSLAPNPLGLYDTAGNVAEMTMDGFRFSVGGKLHGSAGGFVRKGGSFLSGEEEIMPGRREEAPFFMQDGPMKARDLGFRPVVSGINTPGGGRMDAVEREYAKDGGGSAEGEQESHAQGPAGTPIEELDRLIAQAENEGIRKNLQSLRASIEAGNVAQEREKVAEAVAQLQSCVSTMESIRNYQFRIHVFRVQGDQTRDKLQTAGGEKRAYLQKILASIEDGSKRTKAAIEKTIDLYKSNMDDVAELKERHVRAALTSLRNAYKGSDAFNRRMAVNLGVVEAHYAKVLRRGRLTRDGILQDIQQSQGK